MTALQDKKILLVEDEALIAAMVADMLTDLGATVIGPASSVPKAMALVETETFDAAVLDINLHGEMVHPVADLLIERGIPVLFASGYGAAASRGQVAIDKPYTQDKLAQGLFEVMASGK
jgi:CheY-like chemotaxis protein